MTPTHPARLRAFALLHALGTWNAASFRYLELGCGNAHNLLPLAAQFPDATFVGVEHNAEHIQQARNVAKRCGLSNLTLVEADLRSFEPPSEPFDYVVAHGVYSWIAPETQHKLLALTAQCLAPLGVACVSYNTFPGWAIRGIVRDVMRDAARDAIDDAARIRAAKGRVAMLQRLASQPEHPYSTLLATELGLVLDKPDAYLLVEHLADINAPIYVKDFLRHAAQHKLKFVCEALPATADGALENELPTQMMAAGMSRIDAEQTVDVLANRQFRATLLCHEETPIRATADFGALAQNAHFAGPIVPMAEEPLLGPGKTLGFQTRSGAVIEVERPLLKAALLALAQAWPRGLTAQETMTMAIGSLRERGLLGAARINENEITTVVADLVELCKRRQIEALPWSPTVREDIPAKPLVHAVTRWEAEQRGAVTTPRHEVVTLEEPLRTLALLLDGSRDLRALVAELSDRFDSGELVLQERLPADVTTRNALLVEIVSQSVVRLHELGLLLPDQPANLDPATSA